VAQPSDPRRETAGGSLLSLPTAPDRCASFRKTGGVFLYLRSLRTFCHSPRRLGDCNGLWRAFALGSTDTARLSGWEVAIRDGIGEKIAHLRELGFATPLEMIRSPEILGYSIPRAAQGRPHTRNAISPIAVASCALPSTGPSRRRRIGRAPIPSKSRPSCAAKLHRRSRRSVLNSAHASHHRHVVSNCAFASSSVGTLPLVTMPAADDT
jgi:hypothetical protein